MPFLPRSWNANFTKLFHDHVAHNYFSIKISKFSKNNILSKFISRPPNGQIWVMSRNLGSSSLSSLLNSKIPKYNFWSEISMVLPIFTWENYLVEFIDTSASLVTPAPFLGPLPHESFLFHKSKIFKMQSFLRCIIF